MLKIELALNYSNPLPLIAVREVLPQSWNLQDQAYHFFPYILSRDKNTAERDELQSNTWKVWICV